MAFSIELLLLVTSGILGVIGLMLDVIIVRIPLTIRLEAVRFPTALIHMTEIGVVVELVLEMALVLLLKDIVVVVNLLELLAKGSLMLIGGFCLNGDHLCGTVVLAGVQCLWNIRLHLQH